ncbi:MULTISPECIES: S9 family peptidase [unclassified Corynebacterium]|uniref:S9 family peptidase n=1 Tax=unclassified Corynebacterium TaxID=2624378 RepID=UPI0029CA62F1|nr:MULTISPECIES: S9 family peptidase [unclassified Corynebacterium]WPF65780.1 S9 family peptidase [Corynebacterium sp. 22KM0430]WPF68274.1 S9 family peptidase [Corynebacterium sp. 21KM1197]
MPENTQAPIAPVHPVTRSHHGREFVDDYEWLRDKESPETLAYLEAENAYTEARAAHLQGLTEAIYGEIKSRVQETDMSVPTRAGQYWYYGRTIEGKDYGLSCRLPVDAAHDPWTPPEIPEEGAVPGEEVLLDLNALAEGHEFFSLGASSVTTSGRYLAYSVDTAGDERFDLYIKDLSTGELLADRLEGIFYGATWAGEEYIFYQRVDEAWRPDSVWRHKVGTPQEADVRVFHEPDGRFSTGVGGTRSERYLMIEAASKITSETWVLDMENPEGEFEVLWPRQNGVEYSVDHAVVAGEDRWVVTHNATGPNFAVGECAAGTGDALPALTDLRELLPHREEVRVEGVDTYAGQIVVAYRRDAIGRAAVMVLDDAGYTDFVELGFEEELYTVGVLGNPEWDAPVIRLSYGSFITPAQVIDLTVATGERVVRKQQAVLGGYDAAEYTAYRLWSEATDGTRIPVSVIHRADLDTSAPNPTLLYAYGSYEASTDPAFSVARLSLLDRGMIFAVAHVRGGGEMGRGWYDHGKMLEKKNTFSDYIAVADDLLARGLTTPETMVAEGGSAGGMLMGAVANMAGDRFAGIQAIVPFVDPLTSMLMPELPLTMGEWEEWGDPLHDVEVYDYMASYAPYENVEHKAYPDILAVTSLNDTRVLYVEPAKWIARLRATAASGEFLLKTEMSAGHGGVSGRYARWKQTAFEYAWAVNKATGREA